RVAARAGHPSIRVRYEDVFAAPAEYLRAIARLAGNSDPRLDFMDSGTAILDVNHTTGGNRNRWQHGKIELGPDQAWGSAYRDADRAVVTIASLPGLLRYRYALRAQSRR